MSTRWRMCRVIAGAVILLAACEKAGERIAVSAQTTPYQTGSLDQILAPIALYPDQLLAQMLMSAGDPANVTKLDAWLKLNASIKGTQLQDEAVKAGFEPSFVALTLFPQVVATMAQQITWTTRLGEVFTADRSAVFNSIQKLRQQAKSMGSLKSTPQQEVETKTTESGQQVIVIEPANPQIVYVPQYNTQVVYTQPASTTVVVQESNDGAAVAAGVIGFTAGIAIGAAVNNNYYYGPYGMRGGGYMYNDAWDDYYDHREDARDDWQDHREDLNENRSDRAKNGQEQRTERTETRNENRPESSAQRTTQAQGAAANRTGTQAQGTTAKTASRTGTTQARGYGDGTQTKATGQRSGGSDAFSGYSSGASERSASSRGQKSRSSSGGSRSGGGRRR
jgi:hypothetical protein